MAAGRVTDTTRRMRPRKTESELLFEAFCSTHHLSVQPIPTGEAKSPDYLVSIGGVSAYFEVKQIDQDASFRPPTGSRTVGEHVRQKISEARKQLQPSAKTGAPCVLLIYNNLDPMQMFGTEEHDFVSAMYGEMTVLLKDNAIVDSFHGRNALLRENHNTSFSAVGHLRRTADGASVCLYENVHARNPLDYGSIPKCIEVRRVQLVESSAS